MYHGKFRSQQVSPGHPKLLEPWTGGHVQIKLRKDIKGGFHGQGFGVDEKRPFSKATFS